MGGSEIIVLMASSFGADAIDAAARLERRSKSLFRCVVIDDSRDFSDLHIALAAQQALSEAVGIRIQSRRADEFPSHPVILVGRRLAPLADRFRELGMPVSMNRGVSESEEPPLAMQLVRSLYEAGVDCGDLDCSESISSSLPRLFHRKVDGEEAEKMRVRDLEVRDALNRKLVNDRRAVRLQFDEHGRWTNSVESGEVVDQLSFAAKALDKARKETRYRHFHCGRSKNALVVGPSLHLWLLQGKTESLAAEHAFHVSLAKGGGQPNSLFDIEQEAALFLFSSDDSPVVAAAENGESNLARIFLSAPASYATMVREVIGAFPCPSIVTDMEHRDGWLRVSAWAAGPIGGSALDALADFLLDHLLIGNRPVARWRTSFFVGFTDINDRARKACAQALMRSTGPNGLEVQPPLTRKTSSSAEADFILPELAAILVPDPRSRAAATEELRNSRSRISLRYHLAPEEALAIRLKHVDFPGGAVDCPLHALRIHFSESHCFLVEWEIGAAAEKDFETVASEYWPKQARSARSPKHELARPLLDGSHATLWRHYLQKQEGTESFARCMDINAQARFASFQYQMTAEDRESRSHDTSFSLLRNGEEVAATSFMPEATSPMTSKAGEVLAGLLKMVFGDGSIQITDDRARVATSLVLSGRRPVAKGDDAFGADAFDAGLARINMVDGYAPGHPYSRPFSQDELHESAYDRFAEFGTLFHVTQHSVSLVAFRHHGDIHDGKAFPRIAALNREPVLSFGEAYVHGEHMRGIYKRIFMHFLFLEAELRRSAAELTRIEADLPLRDGRIPARQLTKINAMRRNLVRVSSTLRQPNLSTQVQGRELAELMERRFGLENDWDTLDRKISALEEVQNAASDRQTAHIVSALAIVGLPLAIMSFFFSLQPSGAGIAPADAVWTPILNMSAYLAAKAPWINYPHGAAIAAISTILALIGHFLSQLASGWTDNLRGNRFRGWPFIGVFGLGVFVLLLFAIL